MNFPKALNESGNYDFSFSGLKSAVLNYLNEAKMKGLAINDADLAASFQRAVVEVLVDKTRQAAREYGQNVITIAGGVSANSGLQEAMAQMCQEEGFTYYGPDKILSTDNAAMIGCRGYYMAKAGKFSGLRLNAKPSLPIGTDMWKG